jgi:hypothetical protein
VSPEIVALAFSVSGALVQVFASREYSQTGKPTVKGQGYDGISTDYTGWQHGLAWLAERARRTVCT